MTGVECPSLALKSNWAQTAATRRNARWWQIERVTWRQRCYGNRGRRLDKLISSVGQMSGKTMTGSSRFNSIDACLASQLRLGNEAAHCLRNCLTWWHIPRLSPQISMADKKDSLQSSATQCIAYCKDSQIKTTPAIIYLDSVNFTVLSKYPDSHHWPSNGK